MGILYKVKELKIKVSYIEITKEMWEDFVTDWGNIYQWASGHDLKMINPFETFGVREITIIAVGRSLYPLFHENYDEFQNVLSDLSAEITYWYSGQKKEGKI